MRDRELKDTPLRKSSPHSWGCNRSVPHPHFTKVSDWTAVSGYESVVGVYGSGIGNDNTGQLLCLCTSAGLSAMGSWFLRHNIRRWSLYSNDGHTIKAIDHIMTWWPN